MRYSTFNDFKAIVTKASIKRHLNIILPKNKPAEASSLVALIFERANVGTGKNNRPANNGQSFKTGIRNRRRRLLRFCKKRQLFQHIVRSILFRVTGIIICYNFNAVNVFYRRTKLYLIHRHRE